MSKDDIVKVGTKKEGISILGVVVHDVQRMAKIFGILRNFGFGNIVGAIRGGMVSDYATSAEIVASLKSADDDLGVRLRQMIEALGITYIKFGQMLSTRYDLLPKNIINEFSKLQDSSPRMPFALIESILNEAYGDYHQYFCSIDPEPLGSASIAQVHRAILVDGSHVVIKVQRPNLLPLIRSDVDILQLFAKVLDQHVEEIAYFNLPSLISEFERSIVLELNFHHECENIEYFMEKYSSHKMFVFPVPHKALTRDNILVMQEIEGKKITLIDPHTAVASQMADAILNLAFDMVVKDGIFHADPHPGNIFATPDDRIGILDFGSVGSFTPRQRQEFMRMILAIQLGDAAVIARSLLSLGHPTKRVVLDDLESDISNILQKYYLNSLQKIDVAAFANEFVAAGQKFGVQIPAEFTNAVRSLLNIEGIIAYLKPDLDLIKTMGYFSKKLLADNFTRENIHTLIFQSGLNMSDVVRSMPSHFTQLMLDLEHDGIAIRLNENSIYPICDAIHAQGSRISISLLLFGLGLFLWLSDHVILFHIDLVLTFLWLGVVLFLASRERHVKTRLKILPLLHRMKRRREWF